jgi:flagellar biosynthetic protein FliQ
MTGAETLDVARDAIWTIVLVSSPLMVVGLAIFVTLILALPFMADALHSHMMRISSRIIGG